MASHSVFICQFSYWVKCTRRYKVVVVLLLVSRLCIQCGWTSTFSWLDTILPRYTTAYTGIISTLEGDDGAYYPFKRDRGSHVDGIAHELLQSDGVEGFNITLFSRLSFWFSSWQRFDRISHVKVAKDNSHWLEIWDTLYPQIQIHQKHEIPYFHKFKIIRTVRYPFSTNSNSLETWDTQFPHPENVNLAIRKIYNS